MSEPTKTIEVFLRSGTFGAKARADTFTADSLQADSVEQGLRRVRLFIRGDRQ